MRFILLILILFSQFITVFSQTPNYSLQGIITDSYGAGIPNAKVSLLLLNKVESNNSHSFKTKTNDVGNFIFKNLPSGEYKLTVIADGFGSETERLVSVPQNKTTDIRIEVGSGCDRLSEGSGVVTDNYKAEIVKLAFIDAISSGLLMQEQKEKGIIIFTENIKPEWLQKVSDIKLKLMSQNQIQQRADLEGDFLYVSFPYVKVKGQCVAIEVANTWAIAKNSTTIYLSGGGNRYEFRKENGKWFKKSIGGWVS